MNLISSMILMILIILKAVKVDSSVDAFTTRHKATIVFGMQYSEIDLVSRIDLVSERKREYGIEDTKVG